ncbi:MAG TPA: peptidase M4 family protein [Chloroflexi bacterium]|nr:peptidase M4 family protein [Chloroflexota bacterium]HBY08232.1 peptidase M4 family protein [Chloroflexota bacterium]
MSHQFYSIECIIPPHIQNNIAEKGTPEQRKKVMGSISQSAAIRAQRVLLTETKALVEPVTVGGKQRNIFNLNFGSNLPGILARSEGAPPTGDPAVDEAYEGAGATYDLYQQEYQRESIDGKGMRLDSTVHYMKGYDNAFWNGRQMVYGDGDEDLPEPQRIFNRFTIALDIIGHELTHGVTQFEAGLVYRDQSGALNESFSDVFGSLVKQRQRNQTAAEADWIIGEGLLSPNINGIGIRSMKAPGTAYNDPLLGKDPQPAHMSDYKTIDYDNGGVHINSGIPNHAFYATAMEMGGYAWQKAGQIWYVTLRDRLTSTSVFADAAQQTYLVAGNLFGGGSLEQQAVRAGWQAVGIQIDAGDSGGNGGGTGGDTGSGGGTTSPGCSTALVQLLDNVKALIENRSR